jgi:hypothetical protein
MSKVVAYADIQTRLQGIGYSIKWPNTPFVLPTTTDAEGINVPATYLIVEIMGGSSRQIELGDNPTWEAAGQTWVHILSPVDTGPDDSYALADDITAKFRLPPLEPIMYTDISDEPGDPGDDNGNYWRTSIAASWRFQNRVQGS